MIFGSKFLSRMSPGHHVVPPMHSSSWAQSGVIALSALGYRTPSRPSIKFLRPSEFSISFQMIVLGALIARAKGLAAGWAPSRWVLGAGW